MFYKTLSLEQVELKAEGDAPGLAGYASKFNGVDSYGDTILPGAYEKTLKKYGLPKMFFNHDSYAVPLGKWLEASEDGKGLKVAGELTEGIKLAEEVHAALKHKTIDGLSIGYSLSAKDYDEDPATGLRTIRNITRLYEVSIVTFPADEKARITAVKSEEIEQLGTIREFERYLRDAGGFSKSLAAALVSRARVVFAKEGEPQAEIMDPKAEREVLEMLRRFKVPEFNSIGGQ